jgi:hypothetical protein
MDFRNVEMSFGSATLRRPVTTDLGSDLRSGTRQGRSRHIPDRRYSILMPVPIVPAVQSLRFVQDVELGDATWPKLALLYWICRRSDKGRDRGPCS